MNDLKLIFLLEYLFVVMYFYGGNSNRILFIIFDYGDYLEF